MIPFRRGLPVAASALMFCGAAFAPASFAQAPFALKPHDRVVFYGDSITDQRLYTTFIEDYVVTRFPGMPVEFVHSGWGGDRVGGGGGGAIDVRLQRDVIAYKPTVMTIMLGMNDGGYRAFDQPTMDTYTKGYQHIIDTVKAADPDVRFTLLEPSPYDDVTRDPGFPGGYDAVLVKFGQWSKDAAQKQGLGDADLNAPVVAMLQKAKATDPVLAAKIIPDRVHPGPGGHLIMAEAVLKSWNAPAIVTSVEIDAAGHKVANAQNTTVTNLKTDAGLSWTQTDNALPFPITQDMGRPEVLLALSSSDFFDAVDQEPLKITGLAAGKYLLKIDGAKIGTFTQDQLANGVNLAQLATPMEAQAKNVDVLVHKKNDFHAILWRGIVVPLQDNKDPEVSTAIATLKGQEARFTAETYAAAQPKPHQYEVTLQAE